MDDIGFESIIDNVGELKYRYLGERSVDDVPTYIPNGCFFIINTEKKPKRNEIGHWILLANKDFKLHFGDSYAKTIKFYRKLKIGGKVKYMNKTSQPKTPYCAVWAVYYAMRLYGNVPAIHNDIELLRFMKKYMK